jgi:IS5 family transposase
MPTANFFILLFNMIFPSFQRPEADDPLQAYVSVHQTPHAIFSLYNGYVAINFHILLCCKGQAFEAKFGRTEISCRDTSKWGLFGIKKGEVPAGWSDKKKAHKDTDARWTKKNGAAFYGYKNHVNADRKHKSIRKYKVTDAGVHDSWELDNILDPNNACQDVWADSAYRSEEQEASLQTQGRTSHIHERAYRNKPLTLEQETANTERSRVRVRVEHIFGHIETAMNGCYVRTIGFAKAQAKIGHENLAYKISCFSFLMRGANATSAST